MTERHTLLNRVQMHGFAATDAALFLDTHPDSRQALACFRQHQAALAAAKAAYEAKFGPLTLAAQSNDAMWDWIDGPWPWEGRD